MRRERRRRYQEVEEVFLLLFTIELGVNMYAHLWWEFAREPWNWFDFLCCVLSIIVTYLDYIPDAFKLIRLVRTLRALRLFKARAALSPSDTPSRA